MEKFAENVRRDKVQQLKLKELGWRVMVVWECDLRKDSARVIQELSARLSSQD
jgi:DNA mismatch endonuclease (patch repair protein)